MGFAHRWAELWLSGVLSSCSFCPSSSCLVLFRAVWSVVGVCLACTSCRLSLKELTRRSVFLVVCACSVSRIVAMLAALSIATKNVARGFAVARQSKHSSTRSGEGSRTSCFFFWERKRLADVSRITTCFLREDAYTQSTRPSVFLTD